MHLLAIEPHSLTVIIADRLYHTSYAELAGKPMRIRESPALRPSATVLKGQWERFNPKEGTTVP